MNVKWSKPTAQRGDASHRVLPGGWGGRVTDGRAICRRRYLRDGHEDETYGGPVDFPAGTSGRRQRNLTAGKRQRLLEQHAHGGLSQRRFCEGHDLALSTLTYWLRQARRQRATPAGPAVVEPPVELSAEISAAAMYAAW